MFQDHENRENHYTLGNVASNDHDNDSFDCGNVFLPKDGDSKICNDREMGEFLELFNNNVCGLMLNVETSNSIYQLCISLVRKVSQFNIQLIIDDNGMNTAQAIDMSTNAICNKFSEYSTNYKRCKKFESSEMYVAPQQLSLGVRWDMVKEIGATVSIPSLLQCKYQYVPITKTINALFQREDFRSAYLNYNQSNEKNSTRGVYTDFRSGSVFKSNELYKSHPNSLQIEIGTDDFEVCNPLGSKSTLHKICAVYFSIKNMPPQYRSKLDNIFLVALCHSDDLKTKYTDINDVWRVVVNDISQLEEGIYVGDGLTIKGTLAHLSSDNLGANMSLGFVENFGKTDFYCRFCECNRFECKSLHKEMPSKRRTKQSYAEQLTTIQNSEKVDLKSTKGIKRCCELNRLKYYHMLETMTPDIMHDLNEGIIPFLLRKIFKYCISKKIIGEDELKSKIQFHDYGFKNRTNSPSILRMDKGNLNQNATQSLCLFRHIPFILYSLREKLKDVWICVESLLRITQIAYSSRIDEDDLKDMENCIQIHLESVKKYFSVETIPKHHFITHYPAVIRSMGPLNTMSMMRFESKHKTLKEFARGNNNFMDITKTLALKHQQMISLVNSSYTDTFTNGKLTKVNDMFPKDYVELLRKYIDWDEDIYETNWLQHNIFNYREGLLIFTQNNLLEIQKIIINNFNYYFVCVQYDIIEYNKFLNSIRIQKRQQICHSVVKFSSLDNKTVYEKQILDGEYYIILDTLDLKNYVPACQ